MLKASALYYTVIVSLLIMIIVSSMVLLAYHHRIDIEGLRLQEQLDRHAQSAIQLLLSREAGPSVYEETTLLFEEDPSSQVQLRQSWWGFYRLEQATAGSGKKQVSRYALSGPMLSATPTALYLAERGHSLSLCGRTHIEGHCFLPKDGVKRAYIEGQNYQGSQLIYGSSQSSGKELPPVHTAVMETIMTNLNNPRTDSLLFIEEAIWEDSIQRSFGDSPLYIECLREVNIGRGSLLSGHILIHSAFPIRIEAGASIEDILIEAPSIIVEDHFQGSLQAFAKDSLLIGKEVQLHYPSGLNLIASTDNPQAYIRLAEGSRLQGYVFVHQSADKHLNAPLQLEASAEVWGQAYVDGRVSLKGSIYGSLYCKGFYLKTPSATYENYLLNAVINATTLPAYFVQSALLSDEQAYQIIKWLP